MAVGSAEPSTQSSTPSASSREITAAAESMAEPTRQVSPGTTAIVSAAVGVLAGMFVGRAKRKRGNEITGDVAVHLLNKIELLTIRLQVRQARRGGPTGIDVHHVRGDTTSRR
jgi:hypothetical protein